MGYYILRHRLSFPAVKTWRLILIYQPLTMPTIILTEPFIRHYAGSVFRLSDSIGYSGWDEDDRVRDRQPCHDKRVYNLPDDGKGLATELPVDYTILCPENIFENEDLKSGPCRITSISESLKSPNYDPYDANLLPMGKGKVLLNDSRKYSKNFVIVDISVNSPNQKVIFQDLVNDKVINIDYDIQNRCQLDFSRIDPGFYKVDIMQSLEISHSFTVIKHYPLVINYDRINQKYNAIKTLW